jgi:hypothetical protein
MGDKQVSSTTQKCTQTTHNCTESSGYGFFGVGATERSSQSALAPATLGSVAGEPASCETASSVAAGTLAVGSLSRGERAIRIETK